MVVMGVYPTKPSVYIFEGVVRFKKKIFLGGKVLKMEVIVPIDCRLKALINSFG